MVSRTSPLVNAFFIREIIYSIYMLCKHAHNQWQMGGEFVAKLRLHKGQSRKTTPILHTSNYLYHNLFNQFHIFRNNPNLDFTTSNAKWQTLMLIFSTHCIQILSCLHSSKDLQAQKLFVENLELGSQYILKRSTWQT
jgi:hypothetical protein